MKYQENTHNKLGRKTGRIAACATPYVLSFIMAVSPLFDTAIAQTNQTNGNANKLDTKTNAAAAQTDSAKYSTENKLIEYKGNYYYPHMLKVDAYSLMGKDEYNGVLDIADLLLKNFCTADGKELLEKCVIEDMNKQDLLRYAETCEKNGAYGKAGWAYKALGMKDKAEYCFKMDTERIMQDIENIEKNKNSKGDMN